MSGYVIAEIEVHDPATYEEYKQLALSAIEAHGGRFVIRGGAAERLEGEWSPKRVVVIEFESVEKAKHWYSSEQYRIPKELRQRSAETRMIVVDGA